MDRRPQPDESASLDRNPEYDFDFIVIGSGFGGSVSAYRLVEKGYRVAVMEMGRRWTPENLPRSSWSLRRWFWRPGLTLHGFFSMRFFRHVTILHGCAVGGGSITYACTSLRPPDKVWENGTWAGLDDWAAEMPRHYDTASRMLGVVENTILGPADRLLKKVATAAGVGDTFYRTSVAILQAPEGERGGKTIPDPFFGGEGPERTTCQGCGGCMMGCRHGAKNTLDMNYLYLAEKRGGQVFAETRVVDVKPLNGTKDGGEGYEVQTVQSTALFGGESRRFTCKGLVVSASSLGSMELLFHLNDKGSLPRISDQLGKRVRTNSESLIGVRVRARAMIFRRAWPSGRAFISTSIRTSKPCAIRKVLMRWDCWPPLLRAGALVMDACCSGCGTWRVRCCGIPGRPCACCSQCAGHASP
jgi:cholesterol oxidase